MIQHFHKSLTKRNLSILPVLCCTWSLVSVLVDVGSGFDVNKVGALSSS